MGGGRFGGVRPQFARRGGRRAHEFPNSIRHLRARLTPKSVGLSLETARVAAAGRVAAAYRWRPFGLRSVALALPLFFGPFGLLAVSFPLFILALPLLR